MRDLEGFVEILLFEVLFEDTGVEIVVHVLVKPRESSFLDSLQSRRRDRLSIGRTLDAGHGVPNSSRSLKVAYTSGLNSCSIPSNDKVECDFSGHE